ncbi:hypothetical protein PanWU01x14_307070, partial [Parasponia andersonii]
MSLSLSLINRSLSREANQRGRGFRFEQWWMREEECGSVILNSWSLSNFDGSATSFMSGLTNCAKDLVDWIR